MVLSYLGQLRIYSLVDLMLLLLAAGAADRSFLGAILLHVGFLACLEHIHKRPYRPPVPVGFVIGMWLAGLAFFARPEGIMFVLLSTVYARKKEWRLGLVSPLIRGLQIFVLVIAICGFDCFLAWLAAGVIAFRNVLGDFRDAESDAREGKITWPARLGMRNRPFAHLFGTFATTTVWWTYAHRLSVWVLAAALAVEVLTYWLTPRKSNKIAAEELRKIWR